MSVRERFDRIVAGADALGVATPALVRALGLAEELGARPTIVHAVEAFATARLGTNEDHRMERRAAAMREARRKVLHAVDRACLEAGYTDLSPDALLEVQSGHPAQVLLEAARRLEAGLVVLGPHVKRGFFDFGGTARVVLARSDVPVWVQSEEVEPVRRILVAVDFSEHARQAVEIARGLAKHFDAELRVLHAHAPPSIAYSTGFEGTTGLEGHAGPTYVVSHEREAARRELDAFLGGFDWTDVDVRSSFVDDEPVPAIVDGARDTDLLVLGTHGRTGLTRFLLGSVAYATLKRTTTPVLVVPTLRESWLLPETERSERGAQAAVTPSFCF